MAHSRCSINAQMQSPWKRGWVQPQRACGPSCSNRSLWAGSSQGPVSSCQVAHFCGPEGRHFPRERSLGRRGTGEGKPVGLVLRFCGGNCLS